MQMKHIQMDHNNIIFFRFNWHFIWICAYLSRRNENKAAAAAIILLHSSYCKSSHHHNQCWTHRHHRWTVRRHHALLAILRPWVSELIRKHFTQTAYIAVFIYSMNLYKYVCTFIILYNKHPIHMDTCKICVAKNVSIRRSDKPK